MRSLQRKWAHAVLDRLTRKPQEYEKMACALSNSSPSAVGQCASTAECIAWPNVSSDDKGFCAPKTRLNSQPGNCAENAKTTITCNKGYKSNWFYSMDKGSRGIGCLYNCEPDPSSPAAAEYKNPIPTLNCKDVHCKDNARCQQNYYWQRKSSDGFSEPFAVCQKELKQKDCKDADKYITCPKNHKAQAFYQPQMGCYFDCVKESGMSFTTILIVIGVILVVLLLLFLLLHHHGKSSDS